MRTYEDSAFDVGPMSIGSSEIVPIATQGFLVCIFLVFIEGPTKGFIAPAYT